MYNSTLIKPTAKKGGSKNRKGNTDSADNLDARRKQAEARVMALESILDAAESVPPTMVAPVGTPSTQASYSPARDVWFLHTRSPRRMKSSHLRWSHKPRTTLSIRRHLTLALSCIQNLHICAAFLACKCLGVTCCSTCLLTSLSLCRSTGKTKVWANRPGGLTTCLRDHLEKYHLATYYKKCYKEGLTQRCADMALPSNAQPEFTSSGLTDRLVNWVAANDQVCYLSRIDFKICSV